MFTPAFIVVNLLLGASIFLAIYSVFRYPLPAEPAVNRRLALSIGAGRRDTVFEWPILAPIMSLALTIARRFTIRLVRVRIRRDLEAAGNPSGYSVEEYLAVCLACSGLAFLVTAALTAALAGSIEPLTMMMMAIVGFAVPIWASHQAAQSRIMRISKQLPYTLDLIALMMGAGSTFTEAVETIIRDDPDDDFNQELRIVEAEIAFGTSRAAALSNLANRIPLDALRSIIGAVNQAEALGSPLSSILKSQSGMLRMHRSVRAEKLGASASLRILIPSMLILIAVVITAFAPAFIHWAVTGTLLGP